MDINANNVVYNDEFDYSLNELPCVEYGVDGFTSTGLTVIAGQAGLGKTSAIVPLAAQVAHLVKIKGNEFDIRPRMRRKVVYVTEDPNQVARILFGIKKHCSVCSAEEIKDWFKVIPSKRRNPEELTQDITRWRGKYAYEADVDLNCFKVEPLIIIDTSNANIDLGNENDNAEVGRAIAAIKQALGDGMCWVVAHIAKQMTKADAKDLSIRGAGAWCADANATAFLVSDDSLPLKRFLILGKRRFEAEYTEIEITSEVMTASVSTPWGDSQTQGYRVFTLTGLSGPNCMRNQAATAKGEKFEEAIKDVLKEAYANRDVQREWDGLSANQIVSKKLGKSDDVRAALKSLAKQKKIIAKTDGFGRTATVFYSMSGQM